MTEPAAPSRTFKINSVPAATAPWVPLERRRRPHILATQLTLGAVAAKGRVVLLVLVMWVNVGTEPGQRHERSTRMRERRRLLRQSRPYASWFFLPVLLACNDGSACVYTASCPDGADAGVESTDFGDGTNLGPDTSAASVPASGANSVPTDNDGPPTSEAATMDAALPPAPGLGTLIPSVNGAGCESALDCVSGYCVDGLCCDSACAGACERCGLDSRRGQCVRIDCADAGSDDASSLDGEEATSAPNSNDAGPPTETTSDATAGRVDIDDETVTDTTSAEDSTRTELEPDDPFDTDGECFAGSPECPCAPGYIASGAGCSPRLMGLTASAGELNPDFDADVIAYTLHVPLLTEHVTLTLDAPPTAIVAIDGEELAPGQSWTSPALDLGDNLIPIEVSDDRDVGTTYELTATRGMPTTYLKASNIGSDRFGESVALSRDGRTMAAGARFEDSGSVGPHGDQDNDTASNSGAVYLFTRGAEGWTRNAYIKASNTGAGDTFGSSMALSDDGVTLAVGAPNESSNSTGVSGAQDNNDAISSGAVYIFRRELGTWTQQAYIKASNTDAGDAFGMSLALSGDGNTLAVGSADASAATGVNGTQGNNDAVDSGAVYIFHRADGVWSQQAYVKASNTDERDWFGYSVSLSADGSSLAVGAIAEGSNATGVNGDQTNNDVLNAGAVYCFARSDTRWTQTAYIKGANTATQQLFGSSVALSPDATTLAVGASNDFNTGAVYVFRRMEDTWEQDAYLRNTEGAVSDNLGISVALSSTGDVLVAGADGENAGGTADSGALYIFGRTGNTWGERLRLTAFNANEGDSLGRSVALSGDGNTVVAGALGEASSDGTPSDNQTALAGALYVFE